MYVDYPPPRVIGAGAACCDRRRRRRARAPPARHCRARSAARRTLAGLFSLGDAVFDCRAGDFAAPASAPGVRLDTGVFTVRLARTRRPGSTSSRCVLDDDGLPAPAPTERAGRRRARLRSAEPAGSDAAAARFAVRGAPALLRYELESPRHYVRQGRLDRVASCSVASGRDTCRCCGTPFDARPGAHERTDLGHPAPARFRLPVRLDVGDRRQQARELRPRPGVPPLGVARAGAPAWRCSSRRTVVVPRSCCGARGP